MALIIETGLGVASADSYITEADAQAMALLYGLTLPAVAADAEVALRQGYLNLNTHESQLQGSRVAAAQTGIFPRYQVYKDGFLVGSSTIPADVIRAQVYAAAAISGGVDTNAVDNGQDLASFTVNGVYSETYQSSARVKVNSRIQGVFNSLQPFYKSAIGGLTSFRDNEWLV